MGEIDDLHHAEHDQQSGRDDEEHRGRGDGVEGDRQHARFHIEPGRKTATSSRAGCSMLRTSGSGTARPDRHWGSSDHLDAAVGLHLAEIHRQRRMVLLAISIVPRGPSTETSAERLQHLVPARCRRPFRPPPCRHRRASYSGTERSFGVFNSAPNFLLHGGQEGLVGGAVDAGDVGGREIDAVRRRLPCSWPCLRRPRGCRRAARCRRRAAAWSA